MFGRKTLAAVTAHDAIEGRADGPELSGVHFVNERSILAPFRDGVEVFYVAMGCFWGAERVFWLIPGVDVTAAGYIGGFTEHATYQEVCSGRTGHAEAVLVAFDPALVSFEVLLKSFWEEHDPTQLNRQGNDVGTQYRSGIYTMSATQLQAANDSRDAYQAQLAKAGHGTIATEIEPAKQFYYAEEYHQQYLAKNPSGYCGLEGTGVACQVGLK